MMSFEWLMRLLRLSPALPSETNIVLPGDDRRTLVMRNELLETFGAAGAV
jgi:hypothetical protein